jgi:hypothetical protein
LRCEANGSVYFTIYSDGVFNGEWQSADKAVGVSVRNHQDVPSAQRANSSTKIIVAEVTY